jgi:hypothetical protein
MKRLLAILCGASLLGLGLAVVNAAETKADTKGPRPINLEKLNTKADEDDPFLSSNTVLYYSSNAGGKFDIYASRRNGSSAAWPAGKVLEDVQTKVNDRSVCLTPEGAYPQYLFFATQKDKEINNFDIYVAVRQFAGKDFTSPTPINPIATADDEMHPWLASGGKQLYFSRKTKEGWRVFVTSRTQATGAAGFGEPKQIDLPADFHHATLTPDGKTMYLQGPLEKGRWGLFRSTAMVKGGWSKPEPLDELNNEEGPTGDRSPSLSRDGTLLYFASDRPGGKGGLDLWYVPTAQLAKKK